MDGHLESSAGRSRGGRNPVRVPDVLVALGGLVVLVGLSFEWSTGTGYEDLSVLRILVILVAIAGLCLPLVLAVTRKTDVPVVWETLMAPVASILLLIVAIKLVFPPGDGVGTGMIVTALGLLVLSAACWTAISRET